MIRRTVRQFEQIPQGYRIAYLDAHRQGIAYPIGLHLLVRFVRRCWEWSFRYRPSTLENRINKAISEAENQARRQYKRDLERAFERIDAETKP